MRTTQTSIGILATDLDRGRGDSGMEQQQTYESGLLLLHPEDNPWVAPGLAQPLSREEGGTLRCVSRTLFATVNWGLKMWRHAA